MGTHIYVNKSTSAISGVNRGGRGGRRCIDFVAEGMVDNFYNLQVAVAY